MGKSRQKRGKAGRINPTGLLSTRECEEIEEVATVTLSPTVSSLIEKLQDSCDEERQVGCSSIAGLVGEAGAVSQLMHANVTRIMAPLMLDPNPGVRLAALGALRNLSVEGGPQVCQEMASQDIMTPLTAFLTQHGGDWKPASKHLDRDEAYLSYLQALHLLLNICESSELAVEVFNRERLLLLLLPHINVLQYGIQLASTAGRCILTASENNEDACMLLTQQDLLSALMDIVKSPHSDMQQLHLKTIIAGVLCNCVGTLARKREVVEVVLSSLSEVFQVSIVSALHTTLQNLQITYGNAEEAGHNEVTTSKATENMVQELCSACSAHQIALEILSNLCSLDTDDDDEEWEDDDSNKSSLEEQPMLQDSQDMMSDIVECFKTYGIIKQAVLAVGSMCQLDLNFNGQSTLHRQLHTAIVDVKKTGLLCINNIVASLEADMLGGSETLNGMWQQLSSMSTHPAVLGDTELQEATTSAMRAIAQRLATIDTSLISVGSRKSFAYLAGTHLQLVNTRDLDVQYLESLLQSTSSLTQANAVGMLATIGMVLASSNPVHPLIKQIGQVLLQCACSDRELWVVAESLDALFDVFAADETDPIARDIELLPKLQNLLPTLKARISQQKNTVKGHHSIITTSKNNLVRFIKYKCKMAK